MDLFFRGELCIDGIWRWNDRLREVSSLSEREVLHLWRQISASAFDSILSLGLAGVFIRRRDFTLFVLVETMIWATGIAGPALVSVVENPAAAP